MIRIRLFNRAGSFAEDKDLARTIRREQIIPALNRHEEVVLDFENVDSATQSFIHALISDVIRKHGSAALDRMSFRSCNPTVKKIIGIVADYMQEGLGPE